MGALDPTEIAKVLRACSGPKRVTVNAVDLGGAPAAWAQDIATAALQRAIEGEHFLLSAPDLPESRDALSKYPIGLFKLDGCPDRIYATSLWLKPGAARWLEPTKQDWQTKDGESVSPAFAAVLSKHIPVIKTSEERYVLGIVLEPGVVDAQNDTYTAATIRVAAFKFMEEFGNLGLQHRQYINGKVKILENWLTKADELIEGQIIKAGTWMLGVRVIDDELWSAVKKGDITGFSIGGYATRLPVS